MDTKVVYPWSRERVPVSVSMETLMLLSKGIG